MFRLIVLIGILGLYSSVSAFYVIPVKMKIPNVIYVAKSGGDFSDIASALNSISDANKSNHYLIKIAKGVYEVHTPIYMKDYVDIMGAGSNKTVITGTVLGATNALAALVNASSYSTLSGISIINNGTSKTIQSGLYCSSENSFVVNDVNITSNSQQNFIHRGIDSYDCNISVFNSYIDINNGTDVAGIRKVRGLMNVFSSVVNVSDTSDRISAIFNSGDDIFLFNCILTSINGNDVVHLSNDDRFTAYNSQFEGEITSRSSTMKCYESTRNSLLLNESCRIP